MKISFTSLFAFAVGGYLFGSCASPEPARTGSVTEISPDSLVKRGEYLVTTMGCHDCHSPKIMTPQGPEPDPALLLSGHPTSVPLPTIAATKDWVLFNAMSTAAVGPWGVSYSANLTSDSTGIGTWTEEQFAQALKEGKSKGIATNRMLLPPMPWPNYRNLHDTDLKAIFAYLKATKPVRNLVPAPVPPTEVARR